MADTKVQKEIFDAIKIIVDAAIKKSTPNILFGIVTAVNDNNTCVVDINTIGYNLAYYGDSAPKINKKYPVFIPPAGMSKAFVISAGGIDELPIASADNIGGIKVGAGLSITSTGTLSATGGGTADAVEWENVLDKPTTLVGYGISDVASVDSLGLIKIGDNLKIETDGKLSVDTTDIVEQDNTKPITSAAVHVEVGNINALLETI